MAPGLILDIHTAEEVAGDNVQAWGFRVGVVYGTVADTADETAAFHQHVDMGGNE